jgi:hypothetical protein
MTWRTVGLRTKERNTDMLFVNSSIFRIAAVPFLKIAPILGAFFYFGIFTIVGQA